MRKIVFPLRVKVGNDNKIVNTPKDLYNLYYEVKPELITEMSKPFWKEGINLTELVHFPERFTIIQKHLND